MKTRQKCVATDTWRSLGCRTTPLEHWSRRKPTVEPRWAKQQTKKLRPKPTKINSFMSGPSLSLTPDPPAASFTSWGQEYKFLLRNPRVLLALVQTLLTSVFHLKSHVILTPRYLMLSTFSRLVPSKVYEAGIFLIRFLDSCIILHLTGRNLIPHFLAQEPNRSISL